MGQQKQSPQASLGPSKSDFMFFKFSYFLFSLSQGLTMGLGITAVISLNWGWGKGSLPQIKVIESVIGHHLSKLT